MIRSLKLVAIAIMAAFAGTVGAQQIEEELVLITPVAKTLTDPTLADFAKYAKEKWNITVRTSALAAGTPVAYGRILEWKGRPEVDIFWGGESALFDKLAEQKLLAPLDLPKAVLDAIRADVMKFLQQKKEIIVAEFRDLAKTSRKFAVPILEYFDSQKLTQRIGDKRVLRG